MKNVIIFIESVIVVVLTVVSVFLTIYGLTSNHNQSGIVNCSSAYSCVVDDNNKNYKLCYYDDIDNEGVETQKTVYCANND